MFETGSLLVLVLLLLPMLLLSLFVCLFVCLFVFFLICFSCQYMVFSFMMLPLFWSTLKTKYYLWKSMINGVHNKQLYSQSQPC